MTNIAPDNSEKPDYTCMHKFNKDVGIKRFLKSASGRIICILKTKTKERDECHESRRKRNTILKTDDRWDVIIMMNVLQTSAGLEILTEMDHSVANITL